jgi:hypothetical protein
VRAVGQDDGVPERIRQHNAGEAPDQLRVKQGVILSLAGSGRWRPRIGIIAIAPAVRRRATICQFTGRFT